MTLYGLDIIVDKEGQRHILEINGVNSGMNGFKEIYGDNRVEEKVFDMLQEKYGKISINFGGYKARRFKKRHPILSNIMDDIIAIGIKTPGYRKLLALMFENQVVKSDKAHIDWIKETNKSSRKIENKIRFELYNGQESTVFNASNERVPHKTVNPYVNQELTNNKFLQYWLLKDTELKDNLPRSTLVGLGITDENELYQILESAEKFILKPVLGYCGKGVKLLDKDEAKGFRFTRGPLKDPSILQIVHGTAPYIEDLIHKGNFQFEPGISIIQPFIDSQMKNKGVYGVVRAIVCNGEFVDSYLRASTDFRVNFTRDAKAFKFKGDGFDEFCENTISIFEEKCSELNEHNFKQELYRQFIVNRGTTNWDRRKYEAVGILDAVFDIKGI